MENNEETIIFKIITLGESGVGKTSIIKRYVHNIFDTDCLSTIGINFSFKEVERKGKKIQLKFYDTAGQEKYRSLTKSYYKNAEGVLFVFSLDNQNTFEKIKDWVDSFIQNQNGKDNIPRYLIGNKCDLERKIDEESIEDLKNKLNIKKYFETSAKESIKINEVIEELTDDLYKIYEMNNERERSQNSKKLSQQKKIKNKKDCICKIDT